MYTAHFDLETLPFENVPDPKFFFDQGEHARVHHRIKESLKAGRGLTVVTGPVGSGKTTLSQMLISEFSSDIKLIWIAEPPASSLDLFLFLSQELGLTPTSSERTFVLRDIREALVKINSEGNKCLVIIDESHLMSDDTINGIRLLNNLEVGATKLIQILLLGQEELMDIINRPDLEHFKQRIASLEMLGKMDAQRIREYVSHRINVAGGNTKLFADTGWEAVTIAFNSGGTPRIINSLCDRSFNVAFEKSKGEVDAHDVYEASKAIGHKSEIFHYLVSIKGKNDEHLDKPAVHEEPVRPSPPIEPKPKASSPADSVRIKSRATEKPSYSMYSQSAINQTDSGKKSLTTPVIILVISLIAFLSSILFYCSRSESRDIISCIIGLLNL